MDSGNLAWVLTSAALVLFMTPGLALFYGGMDQSKNVLNMLMMNFYCILIVPILWMVAGYSLAQVPFDNDFIGGFDCAFLKDITVAGDGGALRDRGVPRHVRFDHPGPDLRCRGRPDEVRRMGDLRPAVALPRVRPGLQVGVRRMAGPAGVARLRRRHRHPRQRRHRRAGRGVRAREAQG